MARKKNIDPDRILDAAERVVRSRGAHSLTLDLVAAEAGISKGGLTYTFASKEALLTALLDRDVANIRSHLETMASGRSKEAYPELRAFLEICRSSTETTEKRIGPVLAAMMHAPQSLKSARFYLKWMLSTLSPDSEGGRRARLVFYATQGLFLLQGFGLLTLTVSKRRAVVEDFLSFLTDSPQ